MEQTLINLLIEYGYVILFLWSILEGETGLVMAGVMCHTGDMSLPIAIFIAGLGGFVGDQIYFYIGRYNKKYIHNEFKTHRRKFALAHVLLKKYGWPLIFAQRYMYGLRTVIPMAIGVTRYNSRLFAVINFISAMVWASVTVMLAYIYGEEILDILRYGKEHWYFVLPLVGIMMGTLYYYFQKATQKMGES